MSERMIGVGDFHATPHMRELVNYVLDSGRISHGPLCGELEKKWSSIHGCRFGILSSSGTDSIHVAIQSLKEIHGWHDGDEVITAASTFVATVNSILLNNLTPVLVDVEDGYYGIDPYAIEDAVTPRTRAVLIVHLFGLPCNYDVVGVARDYDLALVEDSCETAFVGYKDKMVGSWGDAGAFSFYVCHLVTSGVGGITTTNREEYASKIRSLVNHGRDSTIYWNVDDAKNCSVHRLKEVIGRRFRFQSVGRSARMTELQAAIALPQVDDWQSMIAIRNRNAYRLLSELEQYGDRLDFLHQRPDTTCAFMMFPIICKHDEKPRLCNYLERHGIETRDTPSILNQPVYKGMFDPLKYPVAVKLINRGFYIGTQPQITEDDLHYITDTFRAYFEENPR